MMATVTPINPEPQTKLDFALAYARLGWHVFPCHYINPTTNHCSCGQECKSPAKHPFSQLVPRGQDHATTDEATIRSWWGRQPEANIGIFLAPSGLMAIDIDPRNGGWDTIDALEAQHGPIASDVTQFTGGGGEHRVFCLPTNSGSLPGKLGPGVDVKINGYIMAEPSNHVSGKQYGWEASSSPVDGVVPSPLPDWLRGQFLSSTANKYELPASPVVPLPQADRTDLIAALQHICADDRETWLQVGMALHSTQSGSEAFHMWDEWSQSSSKYDPADQTRVWHSFRNRGLSGVTKATIFQMAMDAGWKNTANFEPAAKPVETVRIAKPKQVEAPDTLLNAPGILRDIAAWVTETSNKPQPQFSVQAAIGFMATVLGRRYVTSNRNWPSLFLMIIGKSGSGKEHAKHAIEDALEQCDLGHLIGPASYTSDSGLLSSLMHQPNHVTIIDEFGKVLESASVKNNNRAQSTMRGLMEVWGRCHGTLRAQGYSTFGMTKKEAEQMNERIVRNPSLTLLSMTTPESFFDNIGSAAARDGFLNRFLIVESDIGRQVSQPFKNIPFPESAKQWVQRVRRHEHLVDPDTNAAMSVAPTLIPFSNAAMGVFDDFEHTCLENMNKYEQHGMAEMFGRTREMAMRLSLIVALGCDKEAVSADHAIWAIQYCDYYAKKTVERLRTSVADNEFDGLKRQVLDLIQKAGEKGMTVRELSRASSKFSRVDKRAQENVLSSLQYLGDIEFVEITTYSSRKRLAWIAVENVEEKVYPPGDTE